MISDRLVVAVAPNLVTIWTDQSINHLYPRAESRIFQNESYRSSDELLHSINALRVIV